MQRTADYGIASYWFLKEHIGHVGGNRGEHDENKPGSWRLSYREMMTWIEQLREWQRDLPPGADEFVEAVKGDLFQEQIFVFYSSGRGEGSATRSTPLDMSLPVFIRILEIIVRGRVSFRIPMIVVIWSTPSPA